MMAVGRDRRNGEKRHDPTVGSAAAGSHHGFPGLDPEAKSEAPRLNRNPARRCRIVPSRAHVRARPRTHI